MSYSPVSPVSSPVSYDYYPSVKSDMECAHSSMSSVTHEDATEKSASDSPGKPAKRFKVLNHLERKGLGAKQKKLKEQLIHSPNDLKIRFELSKMNYQEMASCYQTVKEEYQEEKKQTGELKRKVEVLTVEVEGERAAKRQKLDIIAVLQEDINRLEQRNRNLLGQLDKQEDKLKDADHYYREAHDAHMRQKIRADEVSRQFNLLQARHNTAVDTTKKQTDQIAKQEDQIVEKNRELQRVHWEKKQQTAQYTELQQTLKEEEQKNTELQKELSAQSIREAQDRVLIDDLQKELARYRLAFQIGQKIIDGSIPWEEISKSAADSVKS